MRPGTPYDATYRRLFESPRVIAASPLWPYQPSMGYIVLEMSRAPLSPAARETLPGMLCELERARQLDDLKATLGQAASRIASDGALLNLVKTWVAHIFSSKTGIPLDGELISTLNSDTSMLEERIEQWRREAVEQGLEQGIEQGRVRGHLESLDHILRARFGDSAQRTERLARLPQGSLIAALELALGAPDEDAFFMQASEL